MKKILRFIFNRYRKQFEDFFVEDMFGTVPHALTENSLKFLLTGGTSFDTWIRVSCYALQRKLNDKAVGPSAIAGLLFFKTLDIMIGRLKIGERLQPIDEGMVEPVKNLKDIERGVDEFFDNHPKQKAE